MSGTRIWLIDLARSQKLLEATGTLHANSGGEMGYQLADAGKVFDGHDLFQPVFGEHLQHMHGDYCCL